MSAARLPLLLAQAVPEDTELTTGTILAGVCVMAALAGSLSILSVWRTRYVQGEPVIPDAQRPLLRIPLVLLGVGLMIALMMSAAAVSASLAGSDVDISKDQLVNALLQTIGYDVVLILILGVPVIALKLGRHYVKQDSVVLESLPVTIMEPEPDNPYAVSGVPQAEEADPSRLIADHGAADLVEAEEMADEPWRLSTELRIAGEVCLAAWLPTAALRVGLLALLQDDTQHPFLDLIQNGAGPGVLLLIAVTAVILAPVMEELLYRVVILGGLLSRKSTADSSLFAVGLTSVLFAFAHGFPDSVALLPLAAAITWTYHQRRSYRTVVLVHVLFNGFNIVLAGLSLL